MKKTSLAVLFLTVFIDLIGFGMVIPFLSFYAREYGASGTTVGMVVGIYSIMQFFFAPVWGRLSDRIGRRPVILISLTASCIGYFLFAFSRSLTLLFLSRIVAGAGGANIGTAQAYIADKTTPENRAKGMGIIGAAFGMGFILGPPLSGLLSHLGTTHGMHGNLLPGLAAGSLSLIALLIAFFVLGESKPPDLRPRSGIPPQFDKRVWSWLAAHGLLLAIISTIFITLLAVAGMETSVTLHARDRFHFTQLDLAWFFLFMGGIVAGIQGGLIGKLAKRFGEKSLIAAGTASFTIGLAFVPLVWRVPLLYVVAFFIAVGQGLTYPSLTSLLTKASPSSEHGSMLGLASGIGSLARFIGPIWCGLLYDLAQSRGAFYGSAVLTAIAFVLALRMRKQALFVETAG
ncbi:MAG: transporter, family, tetracycline resistance protein [Thermoanaerobaculia bacterium]|jgi:MFS family permease|nr:transporter, family, tetracycline resistance protein [Thermoanaerobaculia bacterium]